MLKVWMVLPSPSRVVGEESNGGPVHNSARVIGLLGPLKYYACFTKGGDDGSDQEAHIRPEGRTDAQAPRGGTQSSSNPQATGDGSQGRSYTEEE
jgi:hypothetical protein